MITKTSLTLLLATILYTIPFTSHAQPVPGNDPDTSADVPIDGGLSILLAAGVGYVAKKGYEKRKKSQLPKQD